MPDDLDLNNDGPIGIADDPIVVEGEEEPDEGELGAGSGTAAVTAISQSKWWEKIYDDEENGQTAKHLI